MFLPLTGRCLERDGVPVTTRRDGNGVAVDHAVGALAWAALRAMLPREAIQAMRERLVDLLEEKDDVILRKGGPAR